MILPHLGIHRTEVDSAAIARPEGRGCGRVCASVRGVVASLHRRVIRSGTGRRYLPGSDANRVRHDGLQK